MFRWTSFLAGAQKHMWQRATALASAGLQPVLFPLQVHPRTLVLLDVPWRKGNHFSNFLRLCKFTLTYFHNLETLFPVFIWFPSAPAPPLAFCVTLLRRVLIRFVPGALFSQIYAAGGRLTHGFHPRDRWRAAKLSHRKTDRNSLCSSPKGYCTDVSIERQLYQ